MASDASGGIGEKKSSAACLCAAVNPGARLAVVELAAAASRLSFPAKPLALHSPRRTRPLPRCHVHQADSDRGLQDLQGSGHYRSGSWHDDYRYERLSPRPFPCLRVRSPLIGPQPQARLGASPTPSAHQSTPYSTHENPFIYDFSRQLAQTDRASQIFTKVRVRARIGLFSLVSRVHSRVLICSSCPRHATMKPHARSH